MFKNYFLVAWRNLLKNRGFSITNILGLAIGITCTLLIFLWVWDELNYDRFHKNGDHIRQVIAHRNFENNTFTDVNMVLPLAQTLEKDVPEIEHAVAITYNFPQVLQYGNNRIRRSGRSTGSKFFDIFSFAPLSGDPRAALNDPSSIVLTASTATALFGNDEAVGKIIRIDNGRNATVAAVVKDPPSNSTITFDFVQAFNYSDDYIRRAMTDWVNSSWLVYVLTRPSASVATLDKQINAVKKSHDNNDAVSTYFTHPLKKWRLYSEFRDGKNVGGLIDYVRLFSIIAIGILLIACINFMNLSTARSEKRSKEVGIRKTLGSNRKQLIFQFFTESMILAVLAFIISVVAVFLLLPSFNQLVEKQLSLLDAPAMFWLMAAAIVIFTGIVAGSYPALYLSSFNPIRVLKGTLVAGKAATTPRRLLVIGQFVISFLLISGTLIIYQQIQHVKNRTTGYDQEKLLMIPASGDINNNFTVIRNELLQSGYVSSVTRSSSPVTEVWWKSPSPDFEGKPVNSNVIFSGLRTDIGFLKTLGMKIVDGRDFAGTPADTAHMLLNRAAVEALALKNPVGMKMRYGRDYTVIGVTEDLIMESPFEAVAPMMIFFDGNGGSTVTLRMSAEADAHAALQKIQAVFEKYNREFPFEFQFVSEAYQAKFTAEELVNRITNLFAALAIFISCIGLAGLASFTIEKRTREIGIRKVLGATLGQLLALISKEFLGLVVIALAVAIPITWWIMYNWLNNYRYHVNISIWLFAVVGLVVVTITLIVVGFNTVSAGRTSPVKSLRSE